MTGDENAQPTSGSDERTGTPRALTSRDARWGAGDFSFPADANYAATRGREAMSRAPNSTARGDAAGTRARRERLETRAKEGGAARARVESIADRTAPRARGCEGTL